MHSAIDKIYNWRNLEIASGKVVKNKGSGGIDKVSVEKWAKCEEKHLLRLRNSLMNNKYRSKPVKRVYIDKPGTKKKRPLGIPVINDRVCQQAVHNVLSPQFEKYFHEESHGFRPGRSTKSASKRIEQIRRLGYRYVVDLDIKGFFDNVDHEILMRLVRKVVKDRRVLGWLKAGVMEEGKIRYLTSGTPQGGVISPLLSNVYLTPFDDALTGKGFRHIRSADDVLIMCQTYDEATEALEYAKTILATLKLELSEEKTVISTFNDGFDFLGFHFGKRGRGVGRKSLKSFYQKVRETTRRVQGDKPLKKIVENLNPILRGWGNYHNEGRNVGVFTKLDRWVRNRLRSYHNKRWRDRRGTNYKPSQKEFELIGLFSLRSILRPNELQLKLF